MKHKLKFREKIAFGFGDFGGNFCFSFISSFAMIYFTDIVGASVGAVATLLMLAKFFDGITDVIMGHLIDRTHSRMGKARPWLFWSAFPLAFFLIMLFNVPASLSGGAKLAYIFIMYVLVCAFFYTANNISYNALTSLMTDDDEERVSMGSVRFIFTAVAGIIIGSFTTIIVNAFGSGQKGWTAVVILYAAIFFISTMITVFGVHEMNQKSGSQASGENSTDSVKQSDKSSDVSLLESLKLLFTNRYFILTLLIFIVLYLYTGALGTSGMYFAKWILGNDNLYGVLSLSMMIPMLLSLLIAPKLTQKFGMRGAGMLASVFFVLGSLISTIGSRSFLLVVIGVIVRSIGMGPLSTIIFALVASVSDNITLKSGKKIEGMVFSCSSIGIKVGTGIGTAIVGWLLEAGHYKGSLTVQPDSALNMITFSYCVMPLMIGIVCWILFYFMKVEKENASLKKQAELKG